MSEVPTVWRRDLSLDISRHFVNGAQILLVLVHLVVALSGIDILESSCPNKVEIRQLKGVKYIPLSFGDDDPRTTPKLKLLWMPITVAVWRLSGTIEA